MDHVKFTEYGSYLGSAIFLAAAAYFYRQNHSDLLIPAVLIATAFIDLLVIKFYLVPKMRKNENRRS